MALGTLTGRGFVISDIEFKFLESGRAVANFPVAFNKSKKNEQSGDWERTHEAVIRATAWGELAEYINNNFSAKTEIDLSGELFVRKYERKEGGEGLSVEMTVKTVGAPVPKRDGDGGSRGGGGRSFGSNPASNPSSAWSGV